MFVSVLPEQFKILVLGGAGVGKSSIIIQLTENHFIEEYDPHHYDDWRKQIQIHDHNFLYDIAEYSNYEDTYGYIDQRIKEKNIFIIVYSIISRQTIDEVEAIVERIQRVKDYMEYDHQQNSAIVIVGNKCDLEQHREVSTLEMEEYCKRNKFAFIETSALDRTGIDELFTTVIPTEYGRLLIDHQIPDKKSCTTM